MGVRKLNVHLNLNNEDDAIPARYGGMSHLTVRSGPGSVDGVGLFDFDALTNSKGVPGRVDGMRYVLPQQTYR